MDKIPVHKGQRVDIYQCKRQEIWISGTEDKDFSFPKEPCTKERKPGESQTSQIAALDFPPPEAIQNTHFVPWYYQTTSVDIQNMSMENLSKGTSEMVGVEQANPGTGPPASLDKKRKRHAPTLRPSVSIREVEDFLGSTGRNEYAVIDQLTKSPTPMSVWDLVQTSE